MDRVIDRMQKAGIKVILGTPTYSVPAWMYKEHPEIFIARFGGQTITFGYRQNTRAIFIVS
jgi:beta-galactosidase